MPSGHFTKQHITVPCSVCHKDIVFTQGEYNYRLKRTKTGLFFCSKQCADTGHTKADNRSKRLICHKCGKDFTNDLHKYEYTRKLKAVEQTGQRVFCSRTCAITFADTDPEIRKRVADKERGVSAPQRGRMGHVVFPDTRIKIGESRVRTNEEGGVISLTCVQCGKGIERERWYHNRLMLRNQGRGPFCSRACALVNRPVTEETRKRLSDSQINISKPQSGVHGHEVTQETRMKIKLMKIGVPIKVDWDVVVSELAARGVTKYAIMREPIPDAVWIEGDRLVALELEKKRWESDVRRKMRQYKEVDKFDKVILVWYSRDLRRLKEWVLENGTWTLISAD